MMVDRRFPVAIARSSTTVSGGNAYASGRIPRRARTAANWFDIPSVVTASLTATGLYVILIYPGATVVAPVVTTGTCAAYSAALPISWQVYWTIGGTSPSFTITNIQYMYLPN